MLSTPLDGQLDTQGITSWWWVCHSLVHCTLQLVNWIKEWASVCLENDLCGHFWWQRLLATMHWWQQWDTVTPGRTHTHTLRNITGNCHHSVPQHWQVSMSPWWSVPQHWQVSMSPWWSQLTAITQFPSTDRWSQVTAVTLSELRSKYVSLAITGNCHHLVPQYWQKNICTHHFVTTGDHTLHFVS